MKTARNKFKLGLILGCLATGIFLNPLLIQAAEIPLKLNVRIPGLDETLIISENSLGEYVKAFYVWFVGVAGILAAVLIMWAGVRWITAAGNQSRIEQAKTTMNGAVIGLVILLTSYLLLTWINPALIDLRVPAIRDVGRVILGTQFCEDLSQDLQQATRAGNNLGANEEFRCGTTYTVFDPTSGAQSATCIGRGGCGNDKTCAWSGNRDGSFICQDAKAACEQLNSLGQVDPSICATARNYSATGVPKDGRYVINNYYQDCVYLKGKCQFKELISGCRYSTAQPTGGDQWVSCDDCFASSASPPDSGKTKTFQDNDQTVEQYVLWHGSFCQNQLGEGRCVEQGDFTGIRGFDAICCRGAMTNEIPACFQYGSVPGSGGGRQQP